MFKSICMNMVLFYQNFLSPLKPRSCRYYPTCSEYALWQLNKNSLIQASCLIIVRILKCNPFFKGGFDYPRIHKDFTIANACFQPLFLAQTRLKFIYIPCDYKHFYLIKIIF
ncbi:membrane protein insertion efficiency factor YidD [Campylobacter sp. CCS1377]|uniref:Putative membrane protein insertion efficiency factor n=1 Tax=Campylobacter sp. CCS1377 TaxID=3158229 RepID=A0AAU7E611_9BACT|nr:membrane protein insertion efficiency factor YidD [Campylobacter jejuni]